MSQLKQAAKVEVKSNNITGSYRPMFFDLEAFKVSEVQLNSMYYNNEEDDPELALLQEGFSFAYLREDKLRTIDAYNTDGDLIAFNEFLERFSISISSTNLFKTSKYLSRVFRPVRYGGFYNSLNIHVNNNHTLAETDGISLISLELAQSLGWVDAKVNMSAQFTCFYNDGLVKGHCVVSDKITSDIVVYGKDNIKSEISFNSGLQYVSVEPVKLSSSLRLDIQSMLNLWGMFGVNQYLEFANRGIENFKNDLLSSKLSNWLDDFDSITPDGYDKENWTLRKAIYHKIDYMHYPGLVRSSWSMFKNSMVTFADGSNGEPVLRIPVPNGKRAYIRIDLRDHDEFGDFTVSVKPNEVNIDEYGNAWFSNVGIESKLKVLGGADFDDGVAIIPVEDGKAVIYRNPNQFGEFIIADITADDDVFRTDHTNKIIGNIQQKKVSQRKVKSVKQKVTNPLLANFKRNATKMFLQYSSANLIKAYNNISKNATNIGFAANAEMVLSIIGVTNKSLFKKLSKKYNWNLEKIIDATVKDGSSADSEIDTIKAFLDNVIESNIALPNALIHRLTKKKRDLATLHKNHPLDQLLEAIKILIDEADISIIGRGSVSKGNRVAGIIDALNTPLSTLGLANVGNPMYDIALKLLSRYKKNMAIKLTSASDETSRIIAITVVQEKLLNEMCVFTDDERIEIANSWAYQIYKSDRAVHDSILWISDKDGIRGTANDTISMLANIGEGLQIKRNGAINRYSEKRELVLDSTQIRIWSKENLSADSFTDTHELLVESGIGFVGNVTVNIGDECDISDGLYNIKSIAQSRSKRDSSKLLMNSLTIYLS